MSRGNGEIQVGVLEYIGKRGRETTLETLRWELGTQLGKCLSASGTSLPSGDEQLSTSWNTSVTRAVKNLCTGGKPRLTMNSRKLTSIPELLEHFPNKTLSSRVRHLRQELLPILLSDENPGFRAHYSTANGEEFTLAGLDREQRQKLHGMWQSIEPTLIKSLGTVPMKHQNILFKSVARGKHLFCRDGIEVKTAFRDLVNEIIELHVLKPETSAELCGILDQLLPIKKANHLDLKSRLHSIVNFGDRGTPPSMKQEHIELLNERRKDLLQKLHGYKDGYARGGPRSLRVSSQVRCPELDCLINRSALMKFRFLILL
jgi:hypothetical protein